MPESTHPQKNCPHCDAAVVEAELCPRCLLKSALTQANPVAKGEMAGDFQIIERIGEGGMGVVYFAEQRHPVSRDVALKLIRTGMDTERFIARFELERQTLAMMDHPYIARIFDAGTTSKGRLYCAMEFVEGVPVTRFCDRESLSLKRRLLLFLKICSAVQHAHQKGIIHRDLKPSNILVGTEDSPKVIDFGLAKAMHPTGANDLLLSRAGEVFGTPGYMSPEQAAGTPDIDTRSDVFALGAILDDLTKDCEHRGELERVSEKAKNEDADVRYQTVSELARDIEAFLSNKPLSAVRPSLVYRLGKFAQRNRTALLTWSAATVVAGGFALSAAGSRERERMAEVELEQQHEIGQVISSFFSDSVRIAHLNDQQQREAEIYGLLRGISEQFVGQSDIAPEVEYALRQSLGTTFLIADRPDEAEVEFVKARALLPEGEEARAHFIDTKLAKALRMQGRYDEAELLLRRVLNGSWLNNEDRIFAKHELGQMLTDKRQFVEAERLLNEAAKSARELFGDEQTPTLEIRFALASVWTDQKRYGDAAGILREILPLTVEENPLKKKIRSLLEEVTEVLRNESL
jgi:tetratricopeptide (TPR) repeat protein